MRTGASWRNLPKEFGNWATIHRCFHRSVKSAEWTLILKEFREMIASQYLVTDDMVAQLIPEDQRAIINILLPGKMDDGGGTAKDNRLFLETILWWMRTDALRRDIPEEFENWGLIHARFRRWIRSLFFACVFSELCKQIHFLCAMLGGTMVQSDQPVRANMK